MGAMRSKFVTYTEGRVVELPSKRRILAKVEVRRLDVGGFWLGLVSGNSLARLSSVPAVIIEEREWDDRPRDSYDGGVFARWAFGILGVAQ